mgnify:CR=1 FL=1
MATTTVTYGLLAGGKHTVWVPASAIYTETTNGADPVIQTELGNEPELKTIQFDAAADKFAQFSITMPKSWDESSGITYQPYWTNVAASPDTGNVIWSMQAVSFADGDSLNATFGTAVATTAKASSGTQYNLMVSAESGAVTPAGSPAAGEITMFRIFRDADNAADTCTDAVQLLGIKLFFTTDLGGDA